MKINLTNVRFKKRYAKIIMRTLVFLCCFSVFSLTPGNVISQNTKITVDADKTVSIDEVFNMISNQTDYNFIYSEDLFQNTSKVHLKKGKVKVSDLLNECITSNNLDFTLTEDNAIIIKQVSKTVLSEQKLEVSGIVTDENRIPIPGVAVLVKGTKKGTTTDINGHHLLQVEGDFVTLQFTALGYETQEIKLGDYSAINVVLKEDISELDEVLIIGYGTTTQREATGSVSTINSTVIEQQQNQNPMQALQGRLPGVFISTANGRPGANIQVRVRGVNSIGANNNPLYIIDGVPFDSNALNAFDVIGLPSVGNQSPLNSINANDIESVSVLKDADATSIYGSRGANGVILITTKRASKNVDKLHVNINVNSGIGYVANKVDLMNTEQYLEIRNQAYSNDGYAPDPTYDPDVFFEPNQNTDWQEELIGNTAYIQNANVGFNGGSTLSRFSLNGSYRKETTVYPGNANDQRYGLNTSYDFKSADNKLGVSFTASYTFDNNIANTGDFALDILSVPNLKPYNDNGELNWEGSSSWDILNPLYRLYSDYINKTAYLNSNVTLNYNITDKLATKVSMGYSTVSLNQFSGNYSKSISPVSTSKPSAQFANVERRNMLFEPQISYTNSFGKSNLNVLAGATIQRSTSDQFSASGFNYSSDALLKSLSSAGTITVNSDTRADYRYASVFGRVTYNFDKKYILNGTFRRDGSSRFGPGKRYGNFGSIGAAWVFSEEDFIKDNLGFLSFGKLRGSYGTTGNDQIGDYKYLDSWTKFYYGYQGGSSYQPERLVNLDYRWEAVKKFDIALELGLFKNNVMFNINYYKNKTDNQLIPLPLSTITGFSSIQANLPAIIENTGWEFELNITNISTENFSWNTSVNLTIPHNELVRYDGLEVSSNRYNYIIGEPLEVAIGYVYKGVNPDTGQMEFEDLNDDGLITYEKDRKALGSLIPEYYGGLSNTFKYKNWSLNFLFQFVKKEGWDYKHTVFNPIGGRSNFDIDVYNGLKAGTNHYPNPTTFPSNDFYNYLYSSGLWVDSSYIKLRNVYLAYNLPNVLVSKLGMTDASIYLQGQNLLTITNYNGLDPEVEGFFTPPLRTFSVGAKVSF